MTADTDRPAGSAWPKARTALYWALPPLMLWMIARGIDWARLSALLTGADTGLVLAGAALSPVLAMLGALRWHLSRRITEPTPPAPRESLFVYWRALAIGMLTPGAIGVDVYRVLHVGQRTGRFMLPAAAVCIEKFAALAACVLLLAALGSRFSSSALAPYRGLVEALAVSLLVAVGIAWWMASRDLPRVQALATNVARRFDAMAHRVVRAARPGVEGNDDERVVRPGWWRAALWRATLLSVAVFSASALQAQLFFAAIGLDVPLEVNLIVTPVLFLVFTLPISFGSIGVREAAFIVAYGAFGVAAEAALLVSFCGLAAMLVGNGLGALMPAASAELRRDEYPPFDKPTPKEASEP